MDISFLCKLKPQCILKRIFRQSPALPILLASDYLTHYPPLFFPLFLPLLRLQLPPRILMKHHMQPLNLPHLAPLLVRELG